METKNEKQQTNNQCACVQVIDCTRTSHTSNQLGCNREHDCLTSVLQGMAAPLYDRFDQLLDTALQMLELLEGRIDPPIELNEQLIDALELKCLLKVGDTKFATMKKLFKTYEIDKKPYYLKHEVLETIRRYEVISNINKTNS